MHFERREKAMFHLMETKPWRFFMPVFILPDRIQHLFWKYIDPTYDLYESAQAHRLRGRIIEIYQKMDAMLGRLMARLDDSTDLIVVSDHGFGGTDLWFNVNVWLEREGFLVKERRGSLRHLLFYRAMLIG